MAVIKAFCAIRPLSQKSGDIAALPYDVYNQKEARLAVEGKPDSFLRVDRAETTLKEEVPFNDPAVYVQAKKNFEALKDKGFLVQEEKPCLYLYALTMDGREQTGLVSCTLVDDYLNGTIKKHELTREEKEVDRIMHIDTCNAQTGPIFLTYRSKDEINHLVDEVKTRQPLYDFVCDDGIRHQAWRIDQKKEIEAFEKAFSLVEALYIADGHHRCASAVKVALKRRQENPDYTGEESFNTFLSVAFPDEELMVMDYNRVVKDLKGLSQAEFLDAISKDFEIEKIGKEGVHPLKKGYFGMYLDNEWYSLKIKDGHYEKKQYPDCLDVAILQDHLLAPILGIGDPRTDHRIDFVGGIHGLKELERRVHTDMQVAFSMFPTRISEVMDIADAGLLMPPKSTWFEPKLRSGLFIHDLSE